MHGSHGVTRAKTTNITEDLPGCIYLLEPYSVAQLLIFVGIYLIYLEQTE